ncbi:MAG: hypothetical protein K8F91_12705, partial [Candidatus Obscuribacterales bacterium]|nr:hypothetical protein [Candidatus Obscuribacterales bacterium]
VKTNKVSCGINGFLPTPSARVPSIYCSELFYKGSGRPTQALSRRGLPGVPFFVILCGWTIVDYIDISDGLEHGRGGPEPTLSSEQILLDAFKQSFLFAIPAGLVGLSIRFCCFKTSTNKDSSTQ